MEGNKKWWIVGVLIVVAGVLVWKGAGKSSYSTGGTPTPTVVVSPIGTKATTPPVSGGTNSTLTYSQAVAQYTNARIQFDQYCQAHPTGSTFKNGSKIMIDNRSGDPRSIAVGGTVYNLAGYGWRLVTLYSSTLPKTLYLDCGSARNVGSIYLQK